ncbi:hypothetical protein [Aminobacterium mobile]|uniref:hypothetical protein n=2 Tax=Aminobacterium TaxID=81466 RepID=UPI0033164222
MTKNRSLKLFLLVICGFTLISSCSCIAEAKELQQLMDERTVSFWIGGEVLGDMVIGARAQVALVYIDGTLSKALVSDPQAPEWLKWHASHFSSKDLKGRALFAMRYKTQKRWNFEPKMLQIGDYVIKDEDVLTSKDFMIVGDIPPDTTGTLAFSVPGKYVKKGQNITVVCGKDSEVFAVPKR